jgi:ornithine carbamoyltransferase
MVIQNACYQLSCTGACVDDGYDSPVEVVKHAHSVYTDVWTSRGFEQQGGEDYFHGYQVTESLMSHAKPEAVFMHCMPMERGKEVSLSLPDNPCSVIFSQSENRLHVQKALLLKILGFGVSSEVIAQRPPRAKFFAIEPSAYVIFCYLCTGHTAGWRSSLL